MTRFVDIHAGLTVSLDVHERVSVLTKCIPGMISSPSAVTSAAITLRIGAADFTIADDAQFQSGGLVEGW